jgi:hypothetical protein
MPSKAPARISASITRRFTTRLSMRRQKSKRSVNDPPRFARLEDHRKRRLAGALDRTEAIADGLAIHRAEADAAVIDVGWQESQAVVDRVLVEELDLVGIGHFRRQRGGHEGRRMVAFEPGRVVGDQGIGGGVRLVEAVAGELLHQCRRCALAWASPTPLAAAPVTKIVALLGHLLGLLLAHRAPQQVGRRRGCNRPRPAPSASPAPGRS